MANKPENIAREMANAPIAEPLQPVIPPVEVATVKIEDESEDDPSKGYRVPVAVIGNRLSAVMSAVVFSLPTNKTAGKVWIGDKDGSKSVTLANVLIEIAGMPFYLRGKVSARQAKGDNEAVIVFATHGTQYQNCVVCSDPAVKADFQAIKDRVISAFGPWFASLGGMQALKPKTTAQGVKAGFSL